MATVEDWLSLPGEPESWLADWNNLLFQIVKARGDAVEAVCQLAYRDGRYGVLVDGAGVRIDKSVPPLTIHYVNDAEVAETWVASFELPPAD